MDVSSRLRQRLLQAIALLVLVGAGVQGWRMIVRPDPTLLVDLAAQRLAAILGPGVEYEDVQIDLLDGVTIHRLRVRTTQTDLPTLEARRVEIRHDPLALAAGLYRPEQIEIEGARIVARETPEGAAFDFPLHFDSRDIGGSVPRIVVKNATLFYRAMQESDRFRGGTVLVFDAIELDVRPQPDGRLEIVGGFQTRGLGQDDVRIRVDGTADPDADELDLGAVWDPFTIGPFLLGVLADDVAAPLLGRAGHSGRLIVSLSRRADVREGELRIRARWTGPMPLDLESIPGSELIDAQDLEQIHALLDRSDIGLDLTGEDLSLDGLVTALGGTRVHVRGRIGDEGRSLRLVMQIHGLRIENPKVKEALGPDAEEIFASFDPTGNVDADIQITKIPGQDLSWQVDAILEDATFRYVGPPGEDGRLEGFPYRVENAAGRVHISEGLVWFDDIVGLHGRGTMVRLRSPWEEAWTGGETGRIRLTDEGPDIRITVDATDVQVDRDLDDAAAGSEFANMYNEFGLRGVLDRVEVDVIAISGRDEKAYAEVRLTFDDISLCFDRFPLRLENVKGWLTLRRPFIAEMKRGRVFDFDVTGRTDDARVHAWASFRGHEDEGRIQVRGEGVGLAGMLTDTVLASEITRGGLADVWRYLDPRGRADVEMSIPLGANPEPLRLDARLRNASLRLGGKETAFPIEVVDLSGRLRVVGDRVDLMGIRGRIQDAAVAIEGSIEGGPDGRWDVRVTTDVLRVTPELLAALEHLTDDEPLLPSGLVLESGTRLTLDLGLHREPGSGQTVEARIRVTDLDGSLRLPDGASLALRGGVIEVHGGELSFENIEAVAPGVRVEIARAHVGPDGTGGHITLHLDALEPPPELLSLFPEDVRDLLETWSTDRRLACEALHIEARPDGSVRLEGDLALLARPEAPPGNGGPRGTLEFRPLELAAPDAGGRRTLRGRVVLCAFSFGEDVPVEDLDGEVTVDRLRLGENPQGRGTVRAHKARLFGVRVRDVVFPVVWRDGILRADPITGVLADGRLRGRLLLHTRTPMAYEGEVRVDGFQVRTLSSDFAPTGPPLSGTGRARVRFQNRSGEVRDLTAAGHVTVRKGNLGDLPVLANIFAFFGNLLDVRDPPKFERAVADFALHDEVVHLRRFDLAGPLFEMPGHGTVDLSGYVDLVFTPDIIKSFALPGIMQFPVVGNVLDALLREDLIYAVRLRGDVRTARPEIVVLPMLGLERGRPFEGTGVPSLPSRRIPNWFR